jgi:cell division topological specificity factor
MSILDIFFKKMGILDIFFKTKSKDVAKQRLTMVLAYERKGLSPNFIDSLREL